MLVLAVVFLSDVGTYLIALGQRVGPLNEPRIAAGLALVGVALLCLAPAAWAMLSYSSRNAKFVSTLTLDQLPARFAAEASIWRLTLVLMLTALAIGAAAAVIVFMQ
jgi:hypothetical protein